MALPSYVGRYEVRHEIARGGFAVAVLAWDEELDSLVAIKILHSELAANSELQLRFVEEARLLRRIRSPSVITVHDVGRLDDGRPYFVMDFADRGTLAPRLEAHTDLYVPDLHGVTALVDAVADGLSAIHHAGIVHRDLKPDNILLQLARRVPTAADAASAEQAEASAALVGADERILVGDLGIAKDLMNRDRVVTLVGGTPLYQAPEQNESEAAITPAADIYAATALLWHALTGQKPPEAHAVTQHLPNLPTAWHEAIEQGMALDPEARFSSMDTWRSAVHEALAKELADSEAHRSTEATSVALTCPYKGLAAYEPEDARFFFGRESLIDDLVRRMQLHRVLVVGGSSGSGKSSLVRAGLIPAIRAGALPGSDGWRVALFTPGRDPMAELYYQVNQTAPAQSTSTFLKDLRANPALGRHLGTTDGTQAPLLLCIDQLEELFTLATEAQRRQFVSAISAMTDPADSRVRVVFSVRADFYGACAQLPWLAERISSNQILVGPMTTPELRRAISEPARRAGLYLERAVVDAVIDEAGNEAGSLPLIAHALVETWMRRRGNTLTLEGFQAAGGVAGAISQTAEAIYEHEFDPGRRQATKRLFLRLVNPGEGTPDTRRVVAHSEIDHDVNADLMHQVVERLTEARLLTVGDVSVQIAHEALLRSWPRLRSWIEERRDDLRTRQRIDRAATEWEGEGRDPDLLYRSALLLTALEWAEKNPDQLSPLGQTFLKASAEARARYEAIASERQRRRRRIRRLAVGALSFLAVGASVASVVAFWEFREAQRSERRAELASAEARARFAGALGAVAHGLVDADPLLALFLAAEAVARADTEPAVYDARAAMISARRELAQGGPFLVSSPISAGDASAIALSPDGSLLAVGTRDGAIRVIDTATQQQVGSILRGHRGGIRDLDFGPRGRQLVSAGADGSVRLWSLDQGREATGRTISRINDVVPGVAFGPSGSIVASANGDGTVRLLDVATGTQIGPPLIEGPLAFKAVDFSPDGRAVVAGYNDGTIFGWALPSRQPIFEPIRGALTSNPLKVAFSPRGDRFATVSSDSRLMLFGFPSGQMDGRPFVDTDQIGAVVFTPDGHGLVGGDSTGALRLWDIEQQRPEGVTPKGHTQTITDVESSADGSLLATLGRDLLIRLWSAGNAYPVATGYELNDRSAKGIAFSSEGDRLAVGDDSGTVRVWRVGEQTPHLNLEGHEHQVWATAFSRDGAWLASADRAGEVRLWSLESGGLEWSKRTEDGAVWTLVFTPDGRQLLSASDTRLRIWNVETGLSTAASSPEDSRITRAALSPDGALVAVATTEGKVTLWDPYQAVVANEIVADDNALWSVAFSPGAEQIATASSDEVVALWDVRSGTQEASFAGFRGGATDVAFLADGVTLVAVDRSGRLHWWDTQTGRRLTDAWQAHEGPSWRIAMHPDGLRFVTAGDDGRVRVWDELSVTEACRISAVALDGSRREQYLGEDGRSVACDREL